MQPIDLNPHDLDIVRAILTKLVPDREVWAFGSRVKWTAKPFSDLDLAIVGDQPLPISVVADLAEAFDESELPIKVDVVDWATTSEAFREIIQKDKVIVQEKTRRGAVSPAPTFAETNETVIPKDWQEVHLGEVADLLIGFPFKSTEYVDHPEAPRLLRGDNVVQGSIRWDGVKRWPTDKLSALDRYWLAEKDVVLAMDRPWIEAGLKHAAVTGYDLPALLVQRVARLRGTQRIDGTFLKYVVASKAFTEYVLSIQTGTAVPHISGGQIKDFRFLMPPLSAQKAIVHVLESVDGKIELNRRMVTNLEESGRALFNSWFIEFDPVKEKVYGREPFGLEFKVAELFPAGFADAELGKVPSSWSVTTLAGIVTERTSKVGGDNGHVVLSAVASGELKRSAEHFTKQVHSQDTSKYKRVEQWDYAYNPSRINIGSIGMLEEPIVGAVSPVYTVLRPAQGYEWFLRFFLDLPQTKEVINQFCSGSVRQSLSFKDFAAIPVVLPPKEIAEAFARRWQELNALRQQLEVESAKLAEVRDTLLPKLMSGEPRVPDELMA